MPSRERILRTSKRWNKNSEQLEVWDRPHLASFLATRPVLVRVSDPVQSFLFLIALDLLRVSALR
jgi:hypothetical protein